MVSFDNAGSDTRMQRVGTFCYTVHMIDHSSAVAMHFLFLFFEGIDYAPMALIDIYQGTVRRDITCTQAVDVFQVPERSLIHQNKLDCCQLHKYLCVRNFCRVLFICFDMAAVSLNDLCQTETQKIM